MSTRFEGAHAHNVRFSIVDGGEEIGMDDVPEGQIALCFNYDEVFYVQGTKSEVTELLLDAVNLLNPKRTVTRMHSELEPGDLLVGEAGGISMVHEVEPSSSMPGLLRVETEHGQLYLDPNTDSQIVDES